MASEVYGGTAAVLDKTGRQVGWARFGKGGRYLGSTGMRRGDRGILQNSIRTVGARQAARTAAAYRTSSSTSGSQVGGYLGTIPRGSNYARNMRESYNRMRATTNLRQTRSGRIVASNTSSRRRG